ncbi:hypothetical protein ABW19_dt0209099 [Dactylella cylindrospora]|nr:hypothetical protein ABW19_dt0209099 [Dactylella cylindrospora]
MDSPIILATGRPNRLNRLCFRKPLNFRTRKEITEDVPRHIAIFTPGQRVVLTNLPNEILAQILEYLDYSTLITIVNKVNRNFRSLVSVVFPRFYGLTPSLWTEVFNNLKYFDLKRSQASCEGFRYLIGRSSSQTLRRNIFASDQLVDRKLLKPSAKVELHPVLEQVFRDRFIHSNITRYFMPFFPDGIRWRLPRARRALAIFGSPELGIQACTDPPANRIRISFKETQVPCPPSITLNMTLDEADLEYGINVNAFGHALKHMLQTPIKQEQVDAIRRERGSEGHPASRPDYGNVHVVVVPPNPRGERRQIISQQTQMAYINDYFVIEYLDVLPIDESSTVCLEFAVRAR